MAREKLQFDNDSGHTLAALLEQPDGETRHYALFAHCFTCSKDIAAATRISRSLAEQGIAVMRFDFTGLGSSDGDFANTNFSSNIDDLLAAADFLDKNFQAPQLLIGHSLGGAAVLAAAQKLAQVKAVVTIGAPANAEHVEHLFSKKKSEIEENEQAQVELAGRHFMIRKQFLDDIKQYNDVEHIGRLRKALLIFHSPVDDTVSIEQAAKIYGAAKHPKSFISLDQADHLLSKKQDSEYVGEVLAAWAKRYLRDE